jgi:hypothetical protein
VLHPDLDQMDPFADGSLAPVQTANRKVLKSM